MFLNSDDVAHEQPRLYVTFNLEVILCSDETETFSENIKLTRVSEEIGQSRDQHHYLGSLTPPLP